MNTPGLNVHYFVAKQKFDCWIELASKTASVSDYISFQNSYI